MTVEGAGRSLVEASGELGTASVETTIDGEPKGVGMFKKPPGTAEELCCGRPR